jgi:hypothetical protein
VDRAEGKLAAAFGAARDVRGLDEIEIVAVPKIGLHDAPATDQPAVARGGHLIR